MPLCFKSFVFRPAPEYLVADGRHQYGHERRDDVEQTVGQVFQRGDLEYGGLRHAA